MRILIMRDGNAVAEINGQAKTAEYLGWPKEMVSKVLNSGEAVDGITLNYVLERERAGTAVIAYTSTTATRFKSLSECARVYGISRTRLERLIESGATADDGRTTFDIPCY